MLLMGGEETKSHHKYVGAAPHRVASAISSGLLVGKSTGCAIIELTVTLAPPFALPWIEARTGDEGPGAAGPEG